MTTRNPIFRQLTMPVKTPFGQGLCFLIPILWKSHKQGTISFISKLISKLQLRYQKHIQLIFKKDCTSLHRAIDSHSLIGNIGGYIGLCLGYNILQVPSLIASLMRIFKDYLNSKKLIKNTNDRMITFPTNEENSNGYDGKH